VLTRWQDVSLARLLEAYGLGGIREEEFPTDGWSGSTFSRLRRRDGTAFVLKRTSASTDWIVRTTLDDGLREAWAATALPHAFPEPGELRFPYLGAAADGDGAAILMPDLTGELIAWDRPGEDGVVGLETLDRVLAALARLHAAPWPAALARASADPPVWCPLPERLTLTSRPTCEVNIAWGGAGGRAAERLLEGWDAWDRQAPAAARELVAGLAADPAPLVAALERLPAAGLHGDLKLANVALGDDGGVGIVDWQMTLVAPAAVELGWFVVSNSSALPVPFDGVLERYRRTARGIAPHLTEADPSAERDLARIVGLLLRGWRKGLDAESGVALASGVDGRADLAEWSAAAVEAADRRL
jgi:hypothetical protein